MRVIDDELLDKLTLQAKSNERLRKNYNLHRSLNDHVQRLLNALEPGTILPVHRHLHTDETYILFRGVLKVHLYNDNKVLIQTILLDSKSGKYGLSIPAGQWHTIEVLETGTVIFEIKQGPYAPLELSDILEVEKKYII
jgi:cupin fold WbuC family metalloprotein